MDRRQIKSSVQILIVFTLFVLFTTYMFRSTHYKNQVRLAMAAIYQDWKACMQEQMKSMRTDKDLMWSGFEAATGRCENYTILKDLRIHKYTNSDDPKYHILPLNRVWPSQIVTIGVGMDVSAEEKLKKDLTGSSKFYGADPIVDNKEVYSRIGQFFPFAVGGRSGVFTASVLDNSTYKNIETVHVDLVYFLKEMIQPRVQMFDSIWIDAEGGEYDMFPLFHSGDRLDQNDITLCQFNLEVHAATTVKQLMKFQDFINRILYDERYVFLRANSVAGNKMMYFINLQNVECARKYLVY